MSDCAPVPALPRQSVKSSNCIRPNSRGIRQRRKASSLHRPRESGDDVELKRALTQSRHIRRPRARRWPVKAAVFFGNRDIVDAGFASAHQAVLVELPLLVAVGAMPLAGIVVPFILKAHGDAIVVERPEILDQAILVLPSPFTGEKGDDGGAAFKDFRTVTPTAVLGIGQRHAHGIARIPGVFGHARLLGGGLSGEGRKRRTRHGSLRICEAASLSSRGAESMASLPSPDS